MPSMPLNAPAERRPNTSVSQIETANLCWRKWWGQKIASVRRPQKHYLLVGGRLHDVGERFLRGETDIYPSGWDEGLEPEERTWLQDRVDMAIEEGIWQVEPGSVVEWPLCLLVGDEFIDAGGMPLGCQADVAIEERNGEEVRVIQEPKCLMDGSPLPPGWDRLPHLVGFIDHYNRTRAGGRRPCVADHKTAKSRRYSKKKRDIQQALQMLVYSCLPFSEFPWLDAIDARYNVFIKDLQEANPVYAVQDVIHREQAAARWQSVIASTEYMHRLRREAPRYGNDKKDPKRGIHFHQVPCALDTRNPKTIKAACDAFGGCEFKDVCFGRCSIEQLTHQFDNYQPPDRKRLKEVTYSLNTQHMGHTNHTGNPRRSSMPFANATPAVQSTPQLTIGQDVFLPDPSANQQYKARIATLNPLTVAIFPEVDGLPVFDTLPTQYRLQLDSPDAVAAAPAPDVPIMGYAQALHAAGMEVGAYQMQPPASAAPGTTQDVTQGAAATAGTPVGTVPGTTTGGTPGVAPDGMYALNTGQPRTEGQVTPPQNPDPTPPTGQEWQAQPGDIVRVNETETGFWAQHAGKEAQVINVDGNGLITILIEGTPFPDIKTSRVAFVGRPTAIEGTAPADVDPALQARIAAAQSWIGKKVHIKGAQIDTTYRGTVTGISVEGVKLDAFGSSIKWELVGDIISADDAPIPGDEKDAKRVSKKKHLESLTMATTLGEIEKIIDAGEAKKTPGIGKRDMAKVREYLDRAKELASQLGDPAATAGAAASQLQGSVPDTDAAFKAGFDDAKKAALQAVSEIIPL